MKLREHEAKSIRAFLIGHHDLLKGRVLDLGCGNQPYRDIVEYAGGKYTGWDRTSLPGAVIHDEDVGDDRVLERTYDTVLMTQVWQYIPLPELQTTLRMLGDGSWILKPGGLLVATGPTNWAVVEKTDLHRFTATGVVGLLSAASFPEVHVETRQSVKVAGEPWSCGWAAWARSAQ